MRTRKLTRVELSNSEARKAIMQGYRKAASLGHNKTADVTMFIMDELRSAGIAFRISPEAVERLPKSVTTTYALVAKANA